jgi:hypothetical protein
MSATHPYKIVDGQDETIRDPGDQPASKYATGPSFAAEAAVARFTPVTLNKPKGFCRSFPKLATMVTVVDLARANETGKRLHLITPEAIAEGACDNLPEAFAVLAVPLIDRDGIAYLWPIRQLNREGVQLESFDKAMVAVDATAQGWHKFFWQAGGYVVKPPLRPERFDPEPAVPGNLRTIDDWIEAAFVGRIIGSANARELARLIGEE